jgi:hypothetical protein
MAVNGSRMAASNDECRPGLASPPRPAAASRSSRRSLTQRCTALAQRLQAGPVVWLGIPSSGLEPLQTLGQRCGLYLLPPAPPPRRQRPRRRQRRTGCRRPRRRGAGGSRAPAAPRRGRSGHSGTLCICMEDRWCILYKGSLVAQRYTQALNRCIAGRYQRDF